MVLADFPPGSCLEVTSPSYDRRGAVGCGDAGDKRVRYWSTHLVLGAYLDHSEDEFRRPPSGCTGGC
jgi:hypothetical protein